MLNVKFLKSVGVDLFECSTREQARELLGKYKKGELLIIARENDIWVKNNLDKDMIIDRMVESTVGATLKYTILRGEA